MHHRSIRLALAVGVLFLCGQPETVRAEDMPGSAPGHLPEEAPPKTNGTAPVEEFERLSVIASRTPQGLEMMSGTIDVITRAEIEAAQYDGVVDMIRHLPGLHVEQGGTRGSLASIYMRGLDPNQTLVMLNGIVLNDPTNARGGSFDLSTLDVLEIERIEIVRGPVSAVHGSAGLAGAINIVPREGKGERAIRAAVSGGRYGYVRGMASTRGELGPLDISVGGSYVKEGVPSAIGGYQGGSVLATVGADLPSSGRVQSTLRYGDSRSKAYPTFSGGLDDAVRQGQFEERDVEELDISLSYEQPVLESFDLALWATTTQRWEALSSPGIPPSVPIEPDTKTRLERYSISGRATARPGMGLDLTLGADAYWEDGTSRGALDFGGGFILPEGADFSLGRFVAAPFAQVNWTSDFGLRVQAGLRVDIPDETSSEVTPRISATWEIPQTNLSVYGSWGEGFKLPSFYALGNSLVGNPGLDPERSKGWDLGLRHSFWDDRVQASLTYFDIRVQDLIDFNSGTFLLENLSRVTSRGVEFQSSTQPVEGLEVTAHLTWNEVREAGSTDMLLNRPEWRGGVGILWYPIDAVSVSLHALFVGSLRAESLPTGVVRLDGYQRVDLALAWALRDGVELELAIDNLLNEDYQETVGVPSPGARPRVGFQFDF